MKKIIYAERRRMVWICRLTLLKHIQIFIFKKLNKPSVEKIPPCVYIRFGHVTFSYLYIGKFSSYFSLDFGAMK